jgi:hypothetical protein
VSECDNNTASICPTRLHPHRPHATSVLEALPSPHASLSQRRLARVELGLHAGGGIEFVIHLETLAPPPKEARFSVAPAQPCAKQLSFQRA